MQTKLSLAKYSVGVGDRFAREASAQLAACWQALQAGVEVVPVWNKSHREHQIIGSQPESVRQSAEAAVKSTGWKRPWHVDADHVRRDILGPYLTCCDYFTLDLADYLGQPAPQARVEAFLQRHPELQGRLDVPGLTAPLQTDSATLARMATQYLRAVEEAAAAYQMILTARGVDGCIIEVSMDETPHPQSPLELLVILAALAEAGVRVQTVAPRFVGRFNKGVDYVGNLEAFEAQLMDFIAVLRFARQTYALAPNLKLSIHSGSDKFSLYPILHRMLQRTGEGLHIKTAGTTWLEELLGLIESDGAGLEFARDVYAHALQRVDELCAPYATVIDIDRSRLPADDEVRRWSAERFAAALRHDPHHPGFNPHLRQLMHVAYKLAAERAPQFLRLLEQYHTHIAKLVTHNLYERHLRPIFIGPGAS
ncbi:MAG: tagaturonate epimerase family protein [Verrucomicrobiota bacterium]|nr:tagaturonate epimerase family protein [Limisphaera sp.]MDW8382839.1 tagaturonate epimerase family protein [Verrucomicrobiota bacterium]